MPPYDPKAKRPKLVPVDDAPAPVDALLGPVDSAPTGEDADRRDAAVAPRSHLSVVPPDASSPPEPAAAADVPAPAGRDLKKVLAIAVTVATVVGLIVAVRRRP